MNTVVLGLGFGDEGKGRLVHQLAKQEYYDYVVRFSGGHQVGHTVVTDKGRHVFSNLGSGTIADVPTYWSKFCTVHPKGILNELEQLELEFPNLTPQLFLDPKCPVVTQYDIEAQQSNKVNLTHGTVGVGFGTTLKRNEDGLSLTLKDLDNPSIATIKLKCIKEYYKSTSEFIIDELISYSQLFYNTKVHVSKPKLSGTNNIFEGSQGLLLDQKYGFFPHVTRSNLTLENISKIEEDGFQFNLNKVILVTRAYQTRHGNGPMTNEDKELWFNPNPNETNVNNKFQGNFRCTILDLDLLKYSTSLVNEQRDNIVIYVTCLDQLTKYNYTINGKLYTCFDKHNFLNDIRGTLGFPVVGIDSETLPFEVAYP